PQMKPTVEHPPLSGHRRTICFLPAESEASLHPASRLMPWTQKPSIYCHRFSMVPRREAMATPRARNGVTSLIRLRARPRRGAGSDNLPHGILRAVRIWQMQAALRIIPPFPVHQEPVMVGAWSQFDAGVPDAVGTFLQADGVLLPLGEVS